MLFDKTQCSISFNCCVTSSSQINMADKSASMNSVTMKSRDEQLVDSTIDVERNPKARIGIDAVAVSGAVKITKVSSASAFLGKLFIGDLILSINDQKIATRDDFMKFVNASTKLKIRVKRDEFCKCKIKPLPTPRAGIVSFDFEMVWRSGSMPIGILVYEDSQKRVIVSIVHSGTLAYESIKPGDIVTKVNGKVVPDKAVAKKMIYQSVLEKQRVTLTIERSVIAALMTRALATYTPANDPPAAKANYDLALAPDILAIMEQNRDFYKSLNPNPSILRASTSGLKPGDPVSQRAQSLCIQSEIVKSPASPTPRTSLPNDKVDETPIEFEDQGKPLQITPKRG